ncbi:DUF1127 domain-containing protein [Dongia soli]|uniref:DUF1127 domain-containing protein n=1 Tax=Dongia soli TaxID=600628 RepID=A0ABU5E8B1_9PROT|nr:DUF1127 domain-containing protein [Dongia soli]MDY0882157.1 DUF1127 domain-containing protein [Dongia soli]
MAQVSCSSSTVTGHHAARRQSASAFSRLVNHLEIWSERHRARRALAGMSDAMLKDIGLSRGEATYEWEKPFWRP